MGLLDFLTEAIGVDPGSYCLRIAKDGKIIFNEPSQISFNKTDSTVSGIGQSIRSTNNDVVFSPVDYSIKDFQAFEMLLRSALKKINPVKFIHNQILHPILCHTYKYNRS